MPVTITVTASIVVSCSPEVVWDYTQDFMRRTAWDSTVLDAQVVDGELPPRVRIRGVGNLAATLQYRQYDRPHRTSLVMEDVRSPFVIGGGGSWSYESIDGGTRWTQTNTILLRDSFVSRLLAPLVRWQFRRATRRALTTARRQIESQSG